MAHRQTEWERLTCFHGVTEELDYHPCSKCQEIAEILGLDVNPPYKTYLYKKDPLKELEKFSK